MSLQATASAITLSSQHLEPSAPSDDPTEAYVPSIGQLQRPPILNPDASRPATMADFKKRDDMVIDMDEKTERGYHSPPRSPGPKTPTGGAAPISAVANNPIFPVLSYCASSILMTVTNKYVLSGSFNLNFFLLCVQVSGRMRGVEEKMC